MHGVSFYIKIFTLKIFGRNCKHQHLNVQNQLPDVFCKKGTLRNFTKITGKHLCQSLFFNKVAGLRLAFFLKKRI